MTVNDETKVQDVCYTKVVDGAARQITRGCAYFDKQADGKVGPNSTLPVFFHSKTLGPDIIEIPYIEGDRAGQLDCYDVEEKIIGSITCTFISDGVKDPSGVNAPPNLIPVKEALNPKP